MAKIKCYGWKATALASNLTIEELTALMKQVTDDPNNQNPKGSFWLYTKSASRKLDAIGWAITYKLADKREAVGDPVPTNGYSGRQSNRR
jgi:hypothetical protein